MASSFLGSLIELQLTSGQTARGVLEGVDPITSTLTIRDANTHASSSFSRSDIANLTMLESQPTQAPATQAQGPPPAAEPAVEAPVASTSYPTESEKPEPSALPEPSYDTSSSKKRRERRRKQDAPILEGEEYHHSPSSNHAQAGPGFDQEFDFDAALGKFDKKKIWEEIRVSFSSFFSSYTAKSDLCCSPSQNADKTDPSQLLVSHNRASTPVQLVRGPNGVHVVPVSGDAGAHSSPRPAHQERRGQQKLGTYEPVLSPSPPPSTAEVPRLRTSTASTDELEDLRIKVGLLEALSGLRVQRSDASASKGSNTYRCTLWRDHKVQAEGLQSGGVEGSLRVEVTASLDSTASARGHVLQELRYLGPVTSSSDASISEALPQKYKQEMGLRAETASVFMRRLRAAAFPDAT